MNSHHARASPGHPYPLGFVVKFLLSWCLGVPLQAAELNVLITDPDGVGIENAVVELIAGAPAGETPVANPAAAVMRQTGQQFAPRLLLVRAGASVDFPNDDPVMHHVYSFSTAKQFELRLYGNEEVPSVTFDRAGPVALGCNIHDHMRGHIYVSAATAYALTQADGRATFHSTPAGNYTVSVWHPRLRKPTEKPTATVALETGDALDVSIVAVVRPDRTAETGRYERGSYE